MAPRAALHTGRIGLESNAPVGLLLNAQCGVSAHARATTATRLPASPLLVCCRAGLAPGGGQLHRHPAQRALQPLRSAEQEQQQELSWTEDSLCSCIAAAVVVLAVQAISGGHAPGQGSSSSSRIRSDSSRRPDRNGGPSCKGTGTRGAGRALQCACAGLRGLRRAAAMWCAALAPVSWLKLHPLTVC